MRIVVDTNILVSATFWTGIPFRIIECAEENLFELLLSKAIIDEFIEVLNYKEIQEKVRGRHLEMTHTIEKLISIASIVEPREKIKAVKDDPDDDKVIECAVEGKADYIVSRDKHLLRLKEFRGIKIASPEEFVKLIAGK